VNDCGDHCITCSDEGVPMRVERIDEARGLALCSAADGSTSTVEIALVEPVGPGDRLLVHAGVALAGLDS
jgi:hydrogenase maturation factor